MAPRVTVHLGDSPRDCFVEVDGERLETVGGCGVAVEGGFGEDGVMKDAVCHVSMSLKGVRVVDERSGIGNS
jgi:hypothetical protein